jgi:spore coat polysaccharide biosynthesis protein SpsF
MKTGVIVQARTSSTRLPEKVLLELPYGGGIKVLNQVIRRLKKASELNSIIIATTTDTEDSRIVAVAEQEKVLSFRGSKENVLERYYLAAKENRLDHVVRVTSDCPCIDPELIDHCVRQHLKENADYTSTSLADKYPHGLDVEVMKFTALEKAYQEAKENFEKEHVTIFIYRSHPELFKIHALHAPEEYWDPSIRITLDTKEDYALLCAVYDYLYVKNEYFGIKEIFALFRSKPWLKNINNNIVQKKVFDTREEELEEAMKILDLQDLKRAKQYLLSLLK